MTECIWYVSGFGRSWEIAVIDGLAAALKAKGVPVKIYVDGGTGGFRTDGVLSWMSLTFFERLALVLFRGKLWHLWGNAPFWWGLVRLRARTVHTTLDVLPEWKGHPTRLFAEQIREGESLLKPTFGMKVAWAGEETEGPSALLLAMTPTDPLRKAVERSGMATANLMDAVSGDPQKGGILLADDTPTSALPAAWFSMQGFPVISRKSPLIRGLLGRGGSIEVEEDTEEAWLAALETARSDEGRAVAAGARRFMKENFAASDAAESLIDLYRSVIKGKD